MHRRALAGAAGLLLVLLAAGCAKKQEQAAVPAAPPTVTITATDFAFSAPDTIPAGVVNVRLVNNGPSLHHVQFMRLGAGKTMADLMASLRNPGPPPSWITPVPGPNPPAPGASAELVVDLAAGNYAIACFVPDEKGVPHVAKGMIRPLVVAPASGPAAAEPVADVQVDLADYSFTLSKDLTAGPHTVRIVNAGSQPHEMFVARLDSGATAEQMVHYVETGMHGRPPALPLGGASGMVPGAHAVLSMDFRPGDYALVCFLPDARDGRDHALHGMVKQIHVL